MSVADPADDPRNLIGRQVTGASGHTYTLGPALGAGSQGLVLAAAEPYSGLALKVLRPSFVRSDPASARVVIQKEHAAMVRLFAQESPFLLRLFDHGSLPFQNLTLPWLALERVPHSPLGLTLAERVAHAVASSGFAFDPVRAMRVLGRIAIGLATLHQAGLVHRDIKPSNVLVRGDVSDEYPLIADFGIVRAVGLAPTLGAAWQLGAPGFAAPEAADSARVGPAADVFSFAALAYLVLSGRPCFQGNAPVIHAIVQKRMGTPLGQNHAVHPSYRSHNLVPELDALLRQALHPDPRQRPADVTAYWGQLGAVICRPIRAQEAPQSSGQRNTAAFGIVPDTDLSDPEPESEP